MEISSEREPHPTYEILEMTARDLDDVHLMQKKSWIETYVNDDYGISEEWINERFESKLSDSGREARVRRFEDGIRNKTLFGYVVRDGEGVVIGAVTPFIEPDTGAQRLGSLYVDDRYYGKGLGAALMSKTIETFDPNKAIELEVAVYNDRAKAFYKKWHFEEQSGTESFYEHIPQIRMIRKAQNEIQR